MIDQATIDRIMDTAQILEVVSDFVSLKRRGANYIGLCPFHNEKTPSFSVSPAKNICKCFSCGKGGNPVNFLMEHEQMSFVEALRYLAQKYHIEIEERELSDEEKKAQTAREGMLLVNSYAQQQFTHNLFDTEEGQNVGLSYFHERGFRNDIIRKFQLGYCYEQRDHFSQTALKEGYNKDYLVHTGLSIEGQEGQLLDRFRGRVMFPVHGLSGKIIAFGGRVMKKSDKLAKYINSPESEIYHKSHVLYGIFFAKQAIIKQDRCFLVEGYTDVLSMHQAGIENAVASSGTSLTPGQIQLIHRFTPNITVLYDGDAAGIKASLRGIDLILKEGMNVKVVLLPDGDDPDSFSRKHTATEFMSFIQAHETDFIRFKTSLLLEQVQNDPIKRAEVISDVVRSIAIIPDKIVMSVYVRETSRMLEVPEEVLIAEINKQKTLAQQNESSHKPEQTPLEPVSTVPPIPDVATKQRVTIFDRYERNIVRYLVRYGEAILYKEEDEAGNIIEHSVAEYILSDLEHDQIKFNHPLYARLLELAANNHKENGFIAETFFVNQADPEISRLSTDLVADKYHLSKIHTKYCVVEGEKDRLQELVPRAMFELKDAILRDEIRHINLKIKEASQNKNMSQVLTLMESLSQKNEIRTTLAKELGERIITP